MIPKAQLLALAKHHELLPTTVQKDYVIGWLLRAISEHEVLSQWVFKGGTCLKKCYFETYRFSEDIDFTIPLEQSVSVDSIKTHINEAVSWIESNSLRYPSTGNELLHVWELEKNGMPSNMHKVFKTHEIDSASISNHAFIPKWEVEL